ncbi:histidine kinase N-terminal 7TM domain-containing protein [Halodesulfurarchaeum sp. HSR-GB]|uniref:histidine kinase N-terminal 7TM domain-containing protein n=1 Tax=Halodesulfurarchaeum sp. HSR-GB TaxID=3074077 RepID=UPI0028666322|nr:histidine kinase N-terminal 7TM domain-containing protein [Halodesulfurarchaeum sp. HSR-GB]MDR5657025.1 histidine kinase N-terminal 7TM domain-containing protein [Halodesulfurarchaeum sp. HSR-GB]
MTTPLILLAALSLSIVLGSAAAILAWREGPEPGARPLAFLLVGQVWWSISSFFRLRAATVESKLFWLMVLWVGVVIIPLAWLLFALEYSGRDRFLKTKYLALITPIPLLTILLVATGSFHDLLNVVHVGYTPNGVLRAEYTGNWYWVVAAYTYALGAIGIALLLELIVSQAFTFRKQGLALFVGLVVPWATNLSHITGVVDIGIDPTPIAFSFSGVAYLFAIRRYELLSANPAPNKRGKRLVFEGMEEMAIVVDNDDHIVDLNRSAESLFEQQRGELLGTPVPDVLSDYSNLLEMQGESMEMKKCLDGSERTYQVGVTSITNLHDRKIGHVLTFHDVTDYVRREQRYQVLNRVFRHNLRTESQLILGQAERLPKESDPVESIKARARAIEKIGDKARDLTAMFERDANTDRQVDLQGAIERSVGTLASQYPNATIHDRPPEEQIEVSSLIETVLTNVIENAVEHNPAPDPQVWVTVERANGRVKISVADDGPGLGEYEIETLEEGSESQLKHTSGLGLWLIKWGTEIAGGTVSFSERDPRGSVVTLDVPATTRSNGMD